MDGCSVQYAENSVREVVPRINGGAVKEERSPLNDAMDCYGHQFMRHTFPRCWLPSGRTPMSPCFEE